jgi:uncharacterized protein YjbI with pentapeptide repeats
VSKFRARDRRHLMGGDYDAERITGDFRCALAYRSTYRDMIFDGCRFEQADFSNSTFVNCKFLSCSLGSVNFTICRFNLCEFVDCVGDLANLSTTHLKAVRVTGGRWEYASFRDVTIESVEFDTQLHGADLRFSSVDGLDFKESNLWGCSISISCKTFVNVAISARSLDLLAGLISLTAGNDASRQAIRSTLTEKSRKMLEALTLKEMDE